MTAKHFDVVVLGRSIGSLVSAALLARRGFTVLVLGQSQRAPSYSFGDRPLLRRSFTMLAATSPAWRRVVVELAQSQTWKRRTLPLAPMLQVLAPGRRFDLPPDMPLLEREIEREFPEQKRVVGELYEGLREVNAAADEAFSRDLVWPPGSFWERRETGRTAALLPHVRAEPDADLLAEFPRGHFFRQVVEACALFGADTSALPPPFAALRLHAAWTRGPIELARGEEELEEFLIDRIEAHGGTIALDDRASAVKMKRGAAAGVLIDGDERTTGATFVVADMDGEAIADLTGGEGIHRRAQREWPRITSQVGRFVTSIVCKKAGVPDALGPEALVFPPLPRASRASQSAVTTARPVLHLQRLPMPRHEDEALLLVEMLLPDRGPIALLEARKAIVDAVLGELPFLERHLVAVDSVHDGLPLWSYEGDKRTEVDRTSLRGASAKPEPMLRQLEVDPPGYLGIGGEPIRGPIERTLLIGRSVLPALGQEGQLLAAWGAARLVTKTDKQKERMRREMWSKIEIG